MTKYETTVVEVVKKAKKILRSKKIMVLFNKKCPGVKDISVMHSGENSQKT